MQSNIQQQRQDEEFAAGGTFRSRQLPRYLTPVTLGIILFIVVVAIVVFSPTTDSRFIYTDF
jgi:hypothetical protein